MPLRSIRGCGIRLKATRAPASRRNSFSASESLVNCRFSSIMSSTECGSAVAEARLAPLQPGLVSEAPRFAKAIRQDVDRHSSRLASSLSSLRNLVASRGGGEVGCFGGNNSGAKGISPKPIVRESLEVLQRHVSVYGASVGW